MRVLLAVDIPDDAIRARYGVAGTDGGEQWDDLYARVRAAVASVMDGELTVVGMCDVTGVLPVLLDATERGVAAVSDESTWLHVAGSVQTMRQYVDG